MGREVPDDRDGVRLAAFDRDADGFAELDVGNARGNPRTLCYDIAELGGPERLVAEREFDNMLYGAFVD